LIEAFHIEELEPALQQARNVLMLTHHGIEDFTFRTQENQLESIDQQIRNARMSGGIIAAISLLVGGIGIMTSCSPASTSEFAKSASAKPSAPRGWPSSHKSSLKACHRAARGGDGVVASYGFVQMLEKVAPTANTPVITPMAMAVAVAFSAAVGVIAGLFPRTQSGPAGSIQALRYE